MKDVKNNWAMMAGVSLVSFGGALVYALFGEESAAVALYFIVASVSLAAFTFYWFSAHKPALKAPWWAYLFVVIFLEFGAFFGGALDDTRAIGAWLAVGVAFVFYGFLERSRLISVIGGAAAISALGIFAVGPDYMGIILEIITGLLFGYGAWMLKNSKQSQAVTNSS